MACEWLLVRNSAGWSYTYGGSNFSTIQGGAIWIDPTNATISPGLSDGTLPDTPNSLDQYGSTDPLPLVTASPDTTDHKLKLPDVG